MHKRRRIAIIKWQWYENVSYNDVSIYGSSIIILESNFDFFKI